MINKISAVQPDGKEPQNRVPTVKGKPAPEVNEQSAALFRSLVIKKMKEGKNK